MDPDESTEPIDFHKKYKQRNKYLRDYYRNKYQDDETYRLAKKIKAKEYYYRKKEYINNLETQLKNILYII